jgi:hypothetical protein
MPYYYTTAVNSNTNGTANTNSSSFSYLGATNLRYQLQKLMLGSYVASVDYSFWVRVFRTTVLSTSGSGITPAQAMPDGPAAVCSVKTGVTLGTLATVSNIQLVFNSRGVTQWAAFNPDEAISGVGATANNAELAVVNQCTTASINLNVTGVHSE